MDEEMGIVEDLAYDYDLEYEFDANQFFDFLKDETESEADEAESWFRFAHEHPPSPFIVKLKLMKAAKANPTKVHKTSSKKTESNKKTSASTISNGDIDQKTPSRETKIKGVKHHNNTPQDNIKAKPKSTATLSKPSGSSFMKPTASHLAKQNKECDIHSGGFGRLQKPLVTAVEKLRSPIRIQNQTTKRQKLEIGYLRKAAHLKHRASFLHKVSKNAVQLESSSNSKTKTTTPKKPALVTEGRAQRRMSQNKFEPLQRPLNTKILDAPKLPQNKKIMIPSNEFQAHPIKDGGFRLNSKHSPHSPPTELFKKLTLKADPETKVISSSKPPQLTKGLKENVAGSYQQEYRRCVRKPNHRGTDRRITEVKI